MRRCKLVLLFIAFFTFISLIDGCTGGTRWHSDPITISIFTGPIMKQDKKAKILFENANPGVEINYIYNRKAGQSFYSKLNDLVDAGKAPDIVFMNSYDSYYLMHHEDWFMDLEDAAQMNGVNLDNYFEPSLLKQASIDNKLMILPYKAHTSVVYYNKTWFDNASLPYPKDGWTWEDFTDLSRELHRYAPKQYTQNAAATINLNRYTLTPLVNSRGGSFVSPDGSTLKGYLDSKETAAALRWLKQQLDDNVINLNHVGSAMIVDLPSYHFADNMGVVGLPHFSDGIRANNLFFSGPAIMNRSQHSILAWQFIQFYTMDNNEFTTNNPYTKYWTSKAIPKKPEDKAVADVMNNELKYARLDRRNIYWPFDVPDLLNFQHEFRKELQQTLINDDSTDLDIQVRLINLTDTMEPKLKDIIAAQQAKK